MLTSKDRAEKSARKMWENDAASKRLGMEIVEVGEGFAHTSLQIEPDHANGHGICHGGVLFSLADSTFAFACNSRNKNTLAQHCTITYISPARIGDTLTAIATEISLTGRNGIYDIKITNQDGSTVSEFRGFSRAIGGQLFEE